jgi:hypothetical protein
MFKKKPYIKPSIERHTMFEPNAGIISFGKGAPKWLYEESVKK